MMHSASLISVAFSSASVHQVILVLYVIPLSLWEGNASIILVTMEQHVWATALGIHVSVQQELQANCVSSNTMNAAVSLARMGLGVSICLIPMHVCALRVILESTVSREI